MKDFLKAVVFIGIFAIPFLPVYVESSYFFPYITGKNFAFRIIVELMFAVWALLALYDAKYRPRFSWILVAFASLVGVMFLADLFGEYAPKSLWSNYERMDGFVTLAHLFMYLVVLGSVITTEKLWSYLLNTSIAVAIAVSMYGLMQHSGMAGELKDRIDSWLGNAAYLAIYMLFHTFIAFYLLVRSKITWQRVFYSLSALLFVYTLLLSGTRGTFLGLVSGSFVMVAYIAIFGARYPQFRKVAASGFVGLAILAGGFFLARDTNLVQGSSALQRIANINIAQDLSVRSVIWGMALEGVKERPVLGWGQSGFSYVFNKYYEPAMWGQEEWFDRVHDIFLDWLIAGGVLGLLAYLSIFVAVFYYLFWQPLRTPKEEHVFNVLERGVLIGLLVGYFVHNLVVFDNIISYIFFIIILALIHSRYAQVMPKVEKWQMDERLIGQFAAPIIGVVVCLAVYFVNVPGMQAAGDLIDALQAPTVSGIKDEYESALSRGSFAKQEIVEQLAQRAIQVLQQPSISVEDKRVLVAFAEQELIKMNQEKPGDARLHVFFSSFYRSLGSHEAMIKAREQAAIARTLSPRKQSVMSEQAVVELQDGNLAKAHDFLKEAYLLDTDNNKVLVLYAAVLVGMGDSAEAKRLIGERFANNFALNDYAVTMVQQSGDINWLIDLFLRRINLQPNVPANRISLAAAYVELGKKDDAISVLNEVAKVSPEYATSVTCFINNIKADRDPNEGCQ